MKATKKKKSLRLEIFTLSLTKKDIVYSLIIKWCASVSRIQESRNLDGEKKSIFVLILNCDLVFMKQKTIWALAVPRILRTKITDFPYHIKMFQISWNVFYFHHYFKVMIVIRSTARFLFLKMYYFYVIGFLHNSFKHMCLKALFWEGTRSFQGDTWEVHGTKNV